MPIPSPRLIEFHRLAPFERVTHQFHEWGLCFDGAIVILPSNSSFIEGAQKLVVVPSRRTIAINLQAPVDQATVWVRGYQSIHLSALDRDGHCLALSFTEAASANCPPQPACLQKISINVAGIYRLVLESKSSFVLEGLQL
ncbi:hypothetical protein [Halomicronema hongdechloris]|uniref:hypothetical protein n=1 Tax=Halomicronema hongdechloris TaxID=1209493 RepID=UPI0009BA9D9F|nr:hypothetical protein [Halomicronema hongdechloris]